jgi:hypothetical protein
VLFKNLKIEVYKPIILPVVLYGCETWSVTLRGKHRLRVLQNRVMRIFGPKREEVAGGWRRLHNEDLHNFKLDEMGAACSKDGRDEKCMQYYGWRT